MVSFHQVFVSRKERSRYVFIYLLLIIYFYERNNNTKIIIIILKDADKPWKVSPLPAEFWESKSNQKKYLDHIYKSLQYSSPEDWYVINNITSFLFVFRFHLNVKC